MNTCSGSVIGQMKTGIKMKKKIPPEIYKAHCMIWSPETMVCYIKVGSYKVTWWLFHTMKRHSWLSNRVTMKAWHPVFLLRFSEEGVKLSILHVPTVQYNTPPWEKIFFFKVDSTPFLNSIFLLYFFISHANLHMVLFSITNASTFFLVA